MYTIFVLMCDTIGFVNEISTRPLNNLHKFILHNQQAILKQFKEEPVALGNFY